MKNISTYPIREDASDATKRKFFFESTGKTDIVKAVEYSFIVPYGVGGLYNLGFGDYDEATDSIIDDVNSNNDDMHSVMSTVLSTIPLFFAANPYNTIAVAGSDSSEEFVKECRLTCTHRRCHTVCKNVDRRIKSYRYFLDKNYEELEKTYIFSGWITALGRKVPYQSETKYDAVLVSTREPLTFALS